MRNDDKIKEDASVSVQFAMLFTDQFGQRKIRVFNSSIPVSKNLNAYYKAADNEATTLLIVKREMSKLMSRGSKSIRESVTNLLVTHLHAYRQYCASNSAPAQLILPESLKMMSLYLLRAMKLPVTRFLIRVGIQTSKLNETG